MLRSVSFWSALIMIVGSGCGPAKGTVEGTVTYKGKAVSDASIQFQSTDSGVGTSGRLDPSGHYKTERPLTVGSYYVLVIPAPEVQPALPPKTPTPPKERTDIPAKYRAATKEGLKNAPTFTVAPGSNTFDLDMKD